MHVIQRISCAFAGAGVSKDCGIPTAWDLMLKTAGLLYASETESIDTSVDLENWALRYSVWIR